MQNDLGSLFFVVHGECNHMCVIGRALDDLLGDNFYSRTYAIYVHNIIW